MKREILFRGKLPLKSTVWIEGYVVKIGKHVNIFDNLLGKGLGVIPETVGEYIQRTDKHGKKVFEGDVIRVSWTEDGDKIEEYFLIEYVDDDDYFGFVLLDLQKACQPSPNLMFDQKFFTNYCEIVSNRWDMTTDDLVKLGLIKSGVRHEK